MKTLIFVVAISVEFGIGCLCHARVPSVLSKEFCRDRALDVIKRKSALPRNICSALARAFQEHALSIADTDGDFQCSDFVVVKPGQKQLPTRRLLFAFRTAHHFVVYYEASNMGLGANALIFSDDSGRATMVWGGVEPDYEKLAKTPAELINRICKERLISDRKFLW